MLTQSHYHLFCFTDLVLDRKKDALLASNSVSTAAVTLLSNAELDTLALGKGDPGLLRADDEDVALTSGKGVVDGVLDVDNVEATIVTLTVRDDTHTTHVTTTSDHDDGASVELDEVGDLAGGKVNLDSVVDLDQRIRVADAVLKTLHVSKQKGKGETHTAAKKSSNLNRGV